MIRKTGEEILASLLVRLKEKTGVNDPDAGTIARTFCEIISEEMESFYSVLDRSVMMSFLSQAQGQFVDLIGAVLNCTRNVEETDENYKARISNQVYVMQSANYTSVRLKALSVEGVRNVVTAEYSRGAGSFSIYVITDAPETPQSILNEVERVVNGTKGFGISAEIKGPELVPLDLKLRLIFSDKVTDIERSAIRQSVYQAIKRDIDNIEMGGSFGTNGLIQLALSTNPKIADVQIATLKINKVNKYASVFESYWNQRIVLKTLEVA